MTLPNVFKTTDYVAKYAGFVFLVVKSAPQKVVIYARVSIVVVILLSNSSSVYV